MHTIWAQINGGSGAARNIVYDTTWSTWRGDDGSSTGLNYFWMDDFNSNQNAVFIDGIPNAYYTTNGGTTWTQIGSNPSPGANSVDACLPDGTLIAAGGNPGSQHVYYSTNGGTSWSDAGALPSQSSSMTVLGAPGRFVKASGGSIFLIGQDSSTYQINVWKSTDRGQTWSSVLAQTSVASPLYSVSYRRTVGGNDIFMVSYPPSGSYSGNAVALSRSTDLGSTWTTVTVDNVKHGSYLGGQYAQATAIDSRNNPGYCANGDWLIAGSYVVDGSGDSAQIFWRSTNDGSSWSVDTSVTGMTAAASVAPWSTTAFIWSDTSNNATWGSLLPNKNNGGAWISTDGGKTWAAQTAAPWDSPNHGIQGMWSS